MTPGPDRSARILALTLVLTNAAIECNGDAAGTTQYGLRC